MHERALERLRGADERLAARVPARRTLAPDRVQATSLAALGRALLDDGVTPDDADAFAAGLGAVADAIVAGFPENVLWDLDYLAACFARELRAGARDRFDESVECAVALQPLFGCGTTIRFRYAHDFLYGFDWSKWVGKAPAERAASGPFDVEFLRYMIGRGRELVELIAEDDAKYPKLPDGVPRNPFAFSREPGPELALHLDLARRGLLPLEAWRIDAVPRWDRPYADLREERAAALASGA